MGDLTKEIPKPMLEISGKPILLHQLEVLKRSGCLDITLIIGHLGEVIENYFGDGSKYGVNINYILEDEPLGTAGALFLLKDEIKEDFIFLFGDIFLDIDFNAMMKFHKEESSALTMFVHPNSHPYDSDLVKVKGKKVVDIDFKSNTRDYNYNNLVLAAVYIASPRIFNYITEKKKTAFEKDIIVNMINNSEAVKIYKSTEYSKDMGTPERYDQTTKDYNSGLTNDRNLQNKQSCIFLDRDGTINEHVGFLNNHSQFKLIDGVAKAIAKINHSKFLCIVLTNQPVIARGEMTLDELDETHKKMETLLGNERAYVDAIYYCPHHPNKGYEGEVPELKFDCECRKPKTGMMLAAAKDYNIDLSKSYMIGDTTLDIMLAKNAGVKSILVKTGEKGMDGKYDVQADFESETLLDAVENILKEEEKNGF